MPAPIPPGSNDAPPPSASPWLSILIPVYNAQAYVRECLDSVHAQLVCMANSPARGVEVIVLDDCSTDASCRIVEQEAQQWPGPPLRLCRHARNQGLSAARNTMLELAQGDYVWFLDADDALEAGAIAALHSIVNNPAHPHPDLVVCDFRLWRQTTAYKHRLRGEGHRHSFAGPQNMFCHDRQALLRGLLTTGQMHMWSKISRRTLWGDDLRFAPGMYYEDMQLVPRLALRAQSFVYVPQVWVAYRQHGQSILATMDLRKACDLGATLLQTRKMLRSDPLHDAQDIAFALSHLAARNFIGAMRFICNPRHGLHGTQRASYARQFLLHWQESTVLNAQQLGLQYLKRGDFWRGLRFAYWLRRARQAKGQAA